MPADLPTDSRASEATALSAAPAASAASTADAPHASADADALRSPLHAEHEALGAAFTDFGGWLMPVKYGSDLAEHHAVRQSAGLFDISHMAEILVTGPDAARFLDHAVTTKVSALAEGRIRYSLLLADDGTVVDDLLVYRPTAAEFLVVANAGNRPVVLAALAERASGFDVAILDRTHERAMIAVQGPAAQSILESVSGLATTAELSGETTLASLGYYQCFGLDWRGGSVLVSRTGYTGEDGFELSVDRADAVDLWRAVLAAGEPLGLVPAGLAARDTLRLEAGMPLYGHELTRAITPQQAGLGRVLTADKPEGFVGREAAVAALPADARMLVGLLGEGRRAARAGYPVVRADDPSAVVGEVTSGALSPTLGVPVAMAFVDPSLTAEGTVLAVDVRGTAQPVTVVPLPFYRRSEES